METIEPAEISENEKQESTWKFSTASFNVLKTVKLVVFLRD